MSEGPMTAEQAYEWITSRLKSGMTVYVSTYTNATKFEPKHSDRFKIGTDGGLYMKPRRSWIFIGSKGYLMVGLAAYPAPTKGK